MIFPSLPQGSRPVHQPRFSVGCRGRLLLCRASWCVVGLLLAVPPAPAQVITVNTHTGKVTTDAAEKAAAVDRRYRQVETTNVPLSKSEMDAKTRLELIRVLQSEQGFAMRPFPRGHKGLTLIANGKLEPAGEAYLNMATSEGLSANPGDRVVVSDIRFDHSKMIFDLNGGPDKKHRFLSHIEIGAGGGWSPVVQDDGMAPVGARLTLAFDGRIPELTGAQVKDLLAPLISFNVKPPVEAFTDTLPSKLKDAILNHHVLVGMSRDMVLLTKGQPEHKSRETDGQTPFEEWIYGRPPEEVDFVRFQGNRVIRLEVANVGVAMAVFTKDEVAGLMRTDGTPLTPTRTVEEADAERNPDTQAPAAPPSLRNPGEKLPTDTKDTQVMKPVQFPTPKSDPQPGADPNAAPGASTPQPAPDASKPAQPPNPGSSQPDPPKSTGDATPSQFVSQLAQPPLM